MTDKRWAVSYIDWFDNDIKTVIVVSNSWHGAMAQHPSIANCVEAIDFTTQETAKQTCFDMDCMIHAEPIPDPWNGESK